MQCRLMPLRARPAQRGCRRLGRSGCPIFPASRTLSDWLVTRPQLSVTPATAARRSGGRGSSPTSRGRAELVAVDCSTRVVRALCDSSLYSSLGAERARGRPSLVVSPACCFTRNIIMCLRTYCVFFGVLAVFSSVVFSPAQGEAPGLGVERRLCVGLVHTARNSHPETGPSDPCERHRREMVTHGNGQ